MTNLPELPEGYFWRVRHPSYHDGWGYSVREDESKLHVSLIRNITRIRNTRVNRGKNIFTNFWFAGETVQVSNTSEETPTLFSRECKGVAPQAVVNAANSILKEWTKQQETAKLIGDYPPKKWDYNKEETA